MKYIKSKFLNLKNGQLSINTYRFADALATDQEDLYSAFKNETGETLTADIEQKFKYDADLKIAQFTGLSGADEFCFQEEAHNIDSIEDGYAVWGLDADYFEY